MLEISEIPNTIDHDYFVYLDLVYNMTINIQLLYIVSFCKSLHLLRDKPTKLTKKLK